MNGSTSLDALFERFESLPSRDAEDAKGEVVDGILAGLGERLARVDAHDERYRRVREAVARVRLLAPGAETFDDAVLALIDSARDAFDDEPLADVIPVRPPPAQRRPEPAGQAVTEASEQSFPASDAPGYIAGDGPR